MAPSRDDFARWLEDPVTRWVQAAHAKLADDNKAEWIRASWENGAASEAFLRELRTRADAYLAITQTTYEGYCDALGEQPNDE
jgi:hypothetical protein